MENALVVVEDDDVSKDLLREAGRFAAAEDATLYPFAMVSNEELERTLSTLDQIAEMESTSYNDEAALEHARGFLEETATEALDVDVAFEPVCRVADEGSRVSATLSAAEEYDCDHVFAAGRKRSPTGKALFGDYVQSLLLEFDGRVTVDLK